MYYKLKTFLYFSHFLYFHHSDSLIQSYSYYLYIFIVFGMPLFLPILRKRLRISYISLYISVLIYSLLINRSSILSSLLLIFFLLLLLFNFSILPFKMVLKNNPDINEIVINWPILTSLVFQIKYLKVNFWVLFL